jgi:hypothetical protein
MCGSDHQVGLRVRSVRFYLRRGYTCGGVHLIELLRTMPYLKEVQIEARELADPIECLGTDIKELETELPTINVIDGID